MSNPPNSSWRGCAAKFPQPVNLPDVQDLVTIVQYINGRRIEYRSSSGEEDILRHVFRWDLTPYDEVFRNGFQARRQQDIPDKDFFNLERYFHAGGRPLDSRLDTTHAFLSTTLNNSWFPRLSMDVNEVTRYEIYAPGGIWIAQTLGYHYNRAAQEEVCFVAGIAPQYIRSAQSFRRIPGRNTRQLQRVDNALILNPNFDPQSQPFRSLNIQSPICDYLDEPCARGPLKSLTISIWAPSQSQRQKQEADDSNSTRLDWYTGEVANSESYNINAAFRSSCKNEAYLFMKNEYVLWDYAAGPTDDRVTNKPLLICEGFPFLTGTAFAEHGIDCAFGYHNRDVAFIFSGNLCAQINYTPHTAEDKIMTITAMFPFLKGTVFESGVDAAFESSTTYEAYLFKGNQYAIINYGRIGNPSPPGYIISHAKPITDGFPSLKDTIFESGMDAAFASHKTNEAYLFKGDSYALINFAPGTTNDCIIDGVKQILPNWPFLRTILPRKNRGLDVHNHTAPHVDNDEPDHDEH